MADPQDNSQLAQQLGQLLQGQSALPLVDPSLIASNANSQLQPLQSQGQQPPNVPLYAPQQQQQISAPLTTPMPDISGNPPNVRQQPWAGRNLPVGVQLGMSLFGHGQSGNRTQDISSILGNIMQAMGSGFANEGRGPGAVYRGAGAALQEPMQQQAFQSQQAQQAAQTAMTQAQTGMIGRMATVMGPNGQMIQLPVNQVAAYLGNQNKGLAAAQVNAAAKVETSRFKTTPVGVFDTQTQTMIPNTGNGVTITPEMASQYSLPSAYVGTQMKITDLASQEKALASLSPQQRTDNKWIMDPNSGALVPVTDTTFTRKDIPGMAGLGNGASNNASTPSNATRAASGTNTQGGGGRKPVYLGGTVLAFNPDSKIWEAVSPSEAAGRQTMKYTSQQMTSDKAEQAVINDVTRKLNNYQSSMAKVGTNLSASDRINIANVINEQMPNIGVFGMNTGVGGVADILGRNKAYRDLQASNPDAAKALADYMTARSTALELQKLETKSSRMSQIGMHLEMAQVPQPGLMNDVAKNAFSNLNQQLDTWQSSIPAIRGSSRRDGYEIGKKQNTSGKFGFVPANQ